MNNGRAPLLTLKVYGALTVTLLLSVSAVVSSENANCKAIGLLIPHKENVSPDLPIDILLGPVFVPFAINIDDDPVPDPVPIETVLLPVTVTLPMDTRAPVPADDVPILTTGTPVDVVVPILIVAPSVEVEAPILIALASILKFLELLKWEPNVIFPCIFKSLIADPTVMVPGEDVPKFEAVVKSVEAIYGEPFMLTVPFKLTVLPLAPIVVVLAFVETFKPIVPTIVTKALGFPISIKLNPVLVPLPILV